MKITNPSDLVRTFHEDEDGIEAVQVVMVVAIAAIILIATMTVGQEVFKWMKDQWGTLKGKKIS